jgi:hypothetical protein
VTTPVATAPTPAASTPASPVAVSATGLSSVAGARGLPIYWLGERSGVTYEVRQLANGQVYIRYLPSGTAPGSARQFLTVGTYPVANAFAVTSKAAARKGVVRVPVGQGAVAFFRKARPASVYLAFTGHDYQIEVFDPKPGEARRLVRSGRVRAVRPANSVPTLASGRPLVVSVLDLKVLSLAVGHPIYWVGPRAGHTYELKEVGSELFLRYLPKDAEVGTVRLLLTVGTYRVQNAYSVTVAAAARPGTQRIDVGSGGVAFYGADRPGNVYLAFPGRDLQLEVFSPSPAEAQRLVREGQVRPVG